MMPNDISRNAFVSKLDMATLQTQVQILCRRARDETENATLILDLIAAAAELNTRMRSLLSILQDVQEYIE